MNAATWIPLIARVLAGQLESDGEVEAAALIREILRLQEAGEDVDDMLRDAAQRWAAEGKPSWESIREARQAIQSRVG